MIGAVFYVFQTLGVGAAGAGALDFNEQKLTVDGRTLWVEAGDFNNDGATDLLVAVRRGADPETRKYLAWFFLHDDGTFSEKPDEERPVPQDASFATVADINHDGQDDVLLMGAQGVSAYYVQGRSVSAAPQEVLKTQTVTPFAEGEDLPLWPFAYDWHRTGSVELAIWRVGTLQFFRRDAGGKFVPRETIQIVPETWTDSSRSGFFRGPYSNRNLSIQITHVFPELTIGDYNGDGKVDLFAIDEDRLAIYTQADGKFSETPAVKLDFSVRTAEERQRKNAYVSGHAIDVNGDGKLDHVINKISGGLQSMKSETRVHLNRGGFKRAPDQTIKRNGFSTLIQLVDLDGDGKPELVEPSAEVGVFAMGRALVSKKLAVDWLITPNKNGLFDLAETRKYNIVFGLDFGGGPMFRGPYPSFGNDFDGDGKLDFMTSPDGKELHFYLGKADGLFDADPSLKVTAEATPYTSAYLNKKTKRMNVVTFFRDMPGKEGKIVVLHNKP